MTESPSNPLAAVDDQGLLHLAGDRPMLINELPGVWRVEEGALDIFAVRLTEGRITGRREFLLRLMPGTGLIGADRFTGQVGLLAVGILGTAIRSDQDPGTSAATIDAWITAVDRAVRATRDAWANSYAKPGAQSLPAGHRIIAPAGRVFWATVNEGELDAADGEKFVPGSAPAATTPTSTLRALPETALTIESTETLATEGRLDAALADYYRRLFGPLGQLMDEREAARVEFGRRSEEATRVRVAEGIHNLAGVGRGGNVIAVAPGAPAPFRALAAVAHALGQDIVLPRTLEEVGAQGRGIHGLAEAVGLRSRIVILRDGWWKDNNGPLLTALAEDNAPVALLPRDGGYVIWNPAKNETTRVNATNGQSVRPHAVMLYRRFDDQPITLGRMLGFSLGRNGKRVVLLTFLSIVGGLLGLLVPYAVGMLVDKIIPRSAVNELVTLAGGLVVAAISTASVGVVRSLVMQQMEQQIDLAAQSALFDRLLRLPVSFLREFSIGDLADRAMGLQAIRQVLTGAVLSSGIGGLMSLMQIGMMFGYNGKLALFGLGAALVSGLVSTLLSRVQLKRERRLAASRGRAESVVLQLISGVAKLKAAAAIGRAEALWADVYATQRDNFVKTQWAANYQMMFQSVFMPLSMVVLYYVAAGAMNPAPAADGAASPGLPGGAAAAAAAALGTGTFLGFSAAYGALLGGVSGLVGAFSSVMRIIPTYERSKPLLTTPPETAGNRRYSGVLSGDIELANVTFRYPNSPAPVLQDLSFEVKSGEFIAIVGPSGSGKSTILRLLLGFEQPESGEVLYDGKPLSSLDVVGVRRQLGVVLQNGRVQPVSMMENIGGGRQITLDEAWDAARKAGLEDDIKAMPMQMHTGLTDGGATLSGGQRQRLMIARALAAKPRILLLDEATSALDNRTQAIVTETVQRLALTRIIIAHRLTTIAAVDRVLVVEAGKVVQDGTFQHLLNTPGLFQDLARRQLN